MASKTGGSSAAAAPPLTAEAAAKLWEGISIVLSRWTALQMAVLNEWGGRHSNFKSHQLGLGLFSLLTQSKKKVYIEDVDEFLRDAMDSLGSLLGDGSVEEIALTMMEMQEGCQEGDFSFIQQLNSRNPPKSGAYVMQATSDSDDDDDDDDDDHDSDDDDDDDHEDSMMIDDAPQPRSNVSRTNTVDESMPEAEDGWTVVAPKRNRGRRN